MPLSIVPDDPILRIPYLYYGPVIDVPWLPFKLQFRGRPLPEWFVLAAAMFVLWHVTDLLLTLIDTVGLDKGLLDADNHTPVWALVHIAASWLAASQTANLVYRKVINTDRSLSYLAATTVNELQRWWWSRGPVDRAVFGAAIPPWVFVNRALAPWLPLPGVARYVLAAFIVTPFARALVARFQSPERAREFIVARAYRRNPNLTLTAGDPVHEQAA